MSREMATEMNVEAERAAFEAWATGPEWNWTMDAMWKTASGEYGETETRREWEIWQAARRAAQPADVGVGELPKPEVKIERGRVWIVKGNQSFMLAYEPDADDPEMAEWYAKQLRCVLSGFTPCVNSTAQGEQPQQAAQSVKTWQERCDWMSDEPATKLMVEAMKAEIADLRAQLACQSQGEPVAWIVGR